MASLTEKQIGPGPVPVWDMQTASAGQIDACCGMGKGVNLLDNWYFLDPVNQRKLTSPPQEDAYFIDRWVGRKVGGEITLNDEGIYIKSVAPTENTHTYTLVNQRLEYDRIKWMIGKTFRLSLLAKSGLYELGFTLESTIIHTGWEHIFESGVRFYVGLYNDDRLDVSLQVMDGASDTFIAAKLEMGTEQTLAVQDSSSNWVLADSSPNKALELLKCQRYFQTFATTAWRPAQIEDFRPVMRVNPTLGTITVGGKTLYTASADL